MLRQQPLPQFRVFLFVLTVDNFKMTVLRAVNTFANPTCCYLSASLHMPVSLPSFPSFQLVPFHFVTVAQGRLLLPHRVCVLRRIIPRDAVPGHPLCCFSSFLFNVLHLLPMTD